MEIFTRKSYDSFQSAGYTAVESYRFSTLAFFGGMLVVAILDKVVHLVAHCAGEHGTKLTSTTRTNLLANEDASTEQASVPPTATEGGSDGECDMEAQQVTAETTGAGGSSSALMATAGAHGDGSRSPTACCSSAPMCNDIGRSPEREQQQQQQQQQQQHLQQQHLQQQQAKPNESASRQPPAVVELMKENNCYALQKMGEKGGACA